MITDIPRTLTLNGVSFTEDEIKFLQDLFPKMDMLVMKKEDIRGNSLLQKSLLAGVAAHLSMDVGVNATLNLTQDGRALLGKV